MSCAEEGLAAVAKGGNAEGLRIRVLEASASSKS